MGKMTVLRRLALRDRVRNAVIWKELGVELLLLHIQRSHMRWVGHLIMMPPGHVPPVEGPRHTRGTLLAGLENSRDFPEKLDEVAGEREDWAFLVRLLSLQPESG